MKKLKQNRSYNLQISIDDDTLRKISKRADRECRSISAMGFYLIKQSLGVSNDDPTRKSS